MLLDTLQDSQMYMKSTLLQCLREQALPSTGITVKRREKDGVDFYTRVSRDPSTGWRMYTGKQIRDIIQYEQKRMVQESSEQKQGN